MRKLLVLISLLLLPVTALASVNITTDIETTGDVNTETNINSMGNVSVAINGVTWNEYNPNYIAQHEPFWNKDRVGLTIGQFSNMAKYFYMPNVLPRDDFNLLGYLVNIIHGVVDPDIAELQYQNEALRNMMKDIYGDKYDKEYCKANT